MSDIEEQREYYERLMDEAGAKYRELIYELQSENVKLRELLADLYESAWLEHPSAFEHTYADRLRKLGVEVYDYEIQTDTR